MAATISPIVIKLKKAAFIQCILVILICLLVLLEYSIKELHIFTLFLKAGVTMNPMTSILILLLALATLLSINDTIHHKKTIRILCGTVLFFCLLKGLLILFDIPFYPDRILFRDQLYIPGIGWSALTPSGIICFSFLSFAILLIDYEIGKGIRIAQYLCFFNILIVLVQLYAWTYEILNILTIIQFAINTAICIFLISLSILFARSDKGATQNLVGSYSTENTVLRILALFIPFLIGWLKLRGEVEGYYSKEMSTAIFTIVSFTISVTLLARNAVLQDRSRKAKERAAEKIRENEDRLKHVMENISEGAGVANVKGQFIFYNKVSRNLFGKEAWYVPKKTEAKDYTYFYPDGRTKVKPSKLPIFRAIIGQTVDKMDIMVKNKDYPEGITLRVKAMPLKNKEGKIEEGITIFRDISYRSNMTILFTTEEKRSKAIIKNLREGIILIDLKNEKTSFNRKTEEFLGQKLNESIKKNDWSEYYGIYSDKENLFSTEDLPFFNTKEELKGKLYIKNKTTQQFIPLSYKTILIKDDYGELFSVATLLYEIKNS